MYTTPEAGQSTSGSQPAPVRDVERDIAIIRQCVVTVTFLFVTLLVASITFGILMAVHFAHAASQTANCLPGINC